jgi:hypothetical protein
MRKRSGAQQVAQTDPVKPRPLWLLEWLDRRATLIAIGLVAFASLRIVATYTVFSHTFDEPIHLACGMEWLAKGTYTCEPQHPPLARVAAAFLPYLSGIRSQGVATQDIYTQPREGIAILYSGHHYDRTLSLARLGILPFFWIACGVVYIWAARYFSKPLAVVALFLFSFTPAVLAHAGLATTDMALTAFLSAAFLSNTSAALFGLCTGLAVLSKFTTLIYLPTAALVAFVWYWATGHTGIGRALRDRIPTLALAILVGALVIWSGYRFSFGPVDFASVRLPAPELFAGIEAVLQHNDRGHWSYLLGERSPSGFWYFYPVALAVKTPLPLLILLVFGCILVFRKNSDFPRLWLPLAFAIGVFQAGMTGHINIGIRHVLPVYSATAILGAAALLEMIKEARAQRFVFALLIILTGWFAGSSLLSHPDYLAYFNPLAGSHPETVLVDSDLDWGQDIKRAAARLHELGAKEVTFPQFIVADLEKEHGFPRLNPHDDLIRQPQGYFVAGATFWKAYRFGLRNDGPIWPDNTPPTERIGKGMFLWYKPPEANSSLRHDLAHGGQ